MELKPVKVQADIMWAFLDTPNQLSGKYQVDLCNLTKEAVGVLEGMGVSVRKKDDQPEKGFSLRLSQLTTQSLLSISMVDQFLVR